MRKDDHWGYCSSPGNREESVVLSNEWGKRGKSVHIFNKY